ncbi:glycosyltransferase [Microbacterium oleivorans]|uniref:glycosyltransferase n=1 Tax=Microbacterium oleivorans TaxID=273677 RepID=UPI0009EF1E2B|nr:glycosyltransferase [Microbacterium oleivorans]
MNEAPVSLIITVLNEESSIQDWLDSLRRQTVRPDELVVVDGGSSDATVALIRESESSLPFEVNLIEAHGANISAGRNLAIRAAKHDWIAVTDAGTNLHERWLERLRQGRAGGDIVAGFFTPAGRTPFERILSAAITPLASEISERTFLPSSRSVMFKRTLWSAAGGYPEWLDYSEDLVFDLAMLNAGGRLNLIVNATVSWSGRSSIQQFFKQYYRYARGDGKAQLWTKRHIARYIAYLFATVAISMASRGRAVALLLALPLGAAYLRRTVCRLLRHENLSPVERICGIVIAPLIVSIGDIAKMAGYPAGLLWRSRGAARVD